MLHMKILQHTNVMRRNNICYGKWVPSYNNRECHIQCRSYNIEFCNCVMYCTYDNKYKSCFGRHYSLYELRQDVYLKYIILALTRLKITVIFNIYEKLQCWSLKRIRYLIQYLIIAPHRVNTTGQQVVYHYFSLIPLYQHVMDANCWHATNSNSSRKTQLL